jgi:aryl-alcohol dehydrogenase-like predicted oxidoreductase
MKIAIGTAQFGLDYGITNHGGMVLNKQIKDILQLALTNQIDTLDTARAYGESELKLGEILESKMFKIVSKFTTPDKSGETNLRTWINSQLSKTLHNLKADSVYAYISHDASFFLNSSRIILAELEKLKVEGLIQKMGVSVYHPDELAKILDICTPDLVQLPLNIFDQRFERCGLLDRLSKQKIEVHARSIFLQGALLDKAVRQQNTFTPFKKYFEKMDFYLDKYNLTPMELCLGYKIFDPRISKLVIGVCSSLQLQEIISATQKIKSSHILDYDQLFSEDLDLIIPSRWKQ